MKIFQKEITLKPRQRGFHLVTDEVTSQIDEIKQIRSGLMQVFIKHTSAGLSLNENADPSVRHDFENFFNYLVPENLKLYTHKDEGTDDMTAHIKSSIIGSQVVLPVTNGRINTGTWQGIYLCEFRNRGGARKIVVTIFGETYE